MGSQLEGGTRNLLKGILMVMLVSFSAAAVIFSLVVILTDFGQHRVVPQWRAEAMFSAFAHQYLNEVHTQKPAAGRQWNIDSIVYKGKGYAQVNASDNVKESILEFIYVIEGKNIRILKINDISGRNLQDAHLALIRYLDFLRDGNFQQAAIMYGGTLSALFAYGGREVPLPDLFASYCSTVSPTGSCPRFVVSDPRYDAVLDRYTFTVVFTDEQDQPLTFVGGTREFTALVRMREPGEFVVLTLPFE